jgi:hypothetical protein
MKGARKLFSIWIIAAVLLNIGCLTGEIAQEETEAPIPTGQVKDRSYANPEAVVDHTWL